MAVLRTEKLTRYYGSRVAVKEVDLYFQSGKVSALLGRNGAGKTTTFLMLSGILKPTSGKIFLDDQEISKMTSARRSASGLIYLPQQHSVFMKATVYDNLFFVVQKQKDAGKRVNQVLKQFELEKIQNLFAYQLSGGEKRRLEIARALLKNPLFLFFDEPFTGIDPITIIEIQKIVQQLRNDGIGIIITDHNVKDSFYISDFVYIIHQGEILSSGTPQEIVKEEKTRELFLGKKFKLA